MVADRQSDIKHSTVEWRIFCGIKKGASVDQLGIRPGRECLEILESFFSREMEGERGILQKVEWNLNMEDGGCEFLRMYRLEHGGRVRLTGKIVTA